MALKRAVRLGLIPRNPVDAVDPLRHSRREVPLLDVHVAERVIEAATGTRLELPVLLAVTTGMRRGEILGLRWADADLEHGSLEVRQALLPGRRFATPKSSSGRRPVALPGQVVEALKAQLARCQETRRVLGPAYEDHDLVVCLGDGRPWEPTTLSSAFHELTRKAGLEGLRFHDLRHLHATVLLRAGIHPKVVADRLGHSTVGVTLDVYSHVVPDLQKEAARAVDAILAGWPSGR
jgi:integrase